MNEQQGNTAGETPNEPTGGPTADTGKYATPVSPGPELGPDGMRALLDGTTTPAATAGHDEDKRTYPTTE